MFGPVMFGFKHTVAGAARKAGLITASAALTCVGAVFLTTAAWIYLSTTHSPSFAALMIGLVYVGAGAVVLAVALSRPHPAPPPQQDALGGLSPMQLILVSFLQGLEQGQTAKRPK
jgi:hypothetical protein